MKRMLPLLFLLFCCVALRAQSPNPRRPREQTNFGAEGDFEKPVLLPTEALNVLRTSKNRDDGMQICVDQEGVPAEEFSASWFAASEIRLTNQPSSGLVVRGERECFGGGHIAQFWVLAKSSDGYRIVFRGKGDGFEVLPGRTSGYRDLELVIVTQAGAYVDNVILQYSNGTYRISKHRLWHQKS